MAHSLQHTAPTSIDWKEATGTWLMAAKKQGRKSFALEFISAHPNTTGGTPEIELAVKAVRLKTLTEIGSTFNSGHFKNWLPTRIKRGSTDVYVFYSGHGLPSEDGRSLFLLPHEANRDLLERTAISQNELVAAIQKSSPKMSRPSFSTVLSTS